MCLENEDEQGALLLLSSKNSDWKINKLLMIISIKNDMNKPTHRL